MERIEAVDSFETELREGKHPVWRRNAHRTLKNLRNPLGARYTLGPKRYRKILKDPDRLDCELRDALAALARIGRER